MPAASKGEYDRARERTKAGTNVTGSSKSSKDRDGGFFSAGKQFVQSVKDNFGRGPSAGRTFTDPKTGKSYKEPEYKPMTFKGLTSKDPANVARNRAAAAKYAAMDAERNRIRNGRDNPGPAPVLRREDKDDKAPVEPEKPNLAMIGAPTTPMLPTEVATPTYGLASLVQPTPTYAQAFQPTPTYAQAFQPMQPLPAPQFDIYGNPLPLNYVDIFGTYPDFLPRA